MRQTAHRPLPALFAIILLVGTFALLMMAMTQAKSVQPKQGAHAEAAEID